MAEHVRVAFQTQPWRVCAMAFALVAIFALTAACGGDDEPAPPAEPAAAAAQAQADEPADQAADQADQTAEQADEQADEPAEQAADQADQPAEQAADQADQPAEQADEPAEQAGPPGPVDIAVDGVTVGELLAMLSTAEVSCVQNQVGPAINAALNISVTTGMASGPIAAPIFSCVSDETATRVAVVLIVADAGLSAETAGCIGGVLAATPAPLFPVTAEAAEGMLACMTEDEAGRAEAVFEIAPEEEAEPEEPEAAAEPDEPGGRKRTSRRPAASPWARSWRCSATDEVACVQTQVGPAINAAQGIMVTTAMASGPIAAPIFGCVSPESGAQVALALIVAEVGLSAETAACVGGVLAASPAPIFPLAADVATEMLACMTDDEAARAQDALGVAADGEAAPEEPEAATEIAAPGGITVGEILAMLSQDEVACVQAQVGPAINAAQGIMVTTAMASGPIAAPIFGCVSPESGAQVALALIAAEVGLSAETTACVGGVLAASPGPIFPLAAEVATEMLACMTDDEAARAQAVLGGG